MDRWKGKVAVVTGASSGIGAAIAKQLAKEGMQVVGLARRVEKVQELNKGLVCTSGGKIVAMKCDITNDKEIETCFKWIKDNLGYVHVLVNNAGLFLKGTTEDAKLENMRRVIDTNLTAVAVCSQMALKQMAEKNIAGHIIHISSIAAHWPLIGEPPMFNVYSPTKFAVKTLTEVMRQELAHKKQKTRVTSISPGLVDTNVFSVGGLDAGDLDNFLKLEPDDISNAVMFVLATPPHVLVQDLIIRPLLSW